MTSEPRRTSARSRPDASFRRRALIVEGSPGPSGQSGPEEGTDAPADRSAPARGESFRQALSRIPDLSADAPDADADADAEQGDDGRDGSDEGRAVSAPGARSSYEDGPDVEHVTTGEPVWTAARGSDADVLTSLWRAGSAQGTATPPAAPAAVPAPPRRAIGRRGTTSVPPRSPGWRRAAFAALSVLLVASIPVLAGTGYRLVTESTDGKLGASGTAPTEPGYEELVESTPTALVVQTAADGSLVGVTFMALGATDGGGSVVFLPVETLLADPAFGITKLASSFEIDRTRPEAASIAAQEVGKILNVGIDEVIELDDQGWSNVVAPVAPFTIDNLDTLDVDGLALETGTVSLGADLVGRYLGARQVGEDELARIARQEQVWRGWLQAVASSELTDAVPGESSSGMGLFARTLAEGPVAYSALPGETETGTASGYRPSQDAVVALVADTVPAPDPGTPGSRRTVRLLNGVEAGPIPVGLSRRIASLGGSVTVVGNGPSFGRDETSIVFANPDQEGYANVLKTALGATGSVRLDREAPDNLDITVVLGSDVLGDLAAVDPDGGPATAAPTTTTTPGDN